MNSNHPVRLTRRELQVVAEAAKGSSNKEIGAVLNLKESTVKVYMRNIRLKDPQKGNRLLQVKHLLRDHQRVQAIRLNEWIQKWRDSIPLDALAEIRSIMAEQVADLLK